MTAALVCGAAVAFSSCSDKSENSIVGCWKGGAPWSVTANVDGAKQANVTVGFDFKSGEKPDAGTFTMTCDYNVTPVAEGNDSVAPYTAKATVKGTWTCSADDKDEYNLAFDQNSLNVEGVNAPYLAPVTDATLNSLARFQKLDDVEVSADGKSLSFEIQNPEEKVSFTKCD